MATAWIPARDLAVLTQTALTTTALGALREAGFEVCVATKECDVHRGEPEACYRCL